MKCAIDRERDALIIVDVQRDFCREGALPVPDGDQIVPALNEYIRRFSGAGALIVATRDWHPPDHLSFREYGGTWPAHCVQGTKGAEFHRSLEIPRGAKILSKATTPDKEAYSGLDQTDLAEQLKALGINRVFVGGLATDYCVKSTVLDALRLGFKTVLLGDAIRGVNLKPPDSERAVEEMIQKGAQKIALSDLA